MNWQHFTAFLWLRWRLRINQFKRAGALNAVILGLIAVAGLFIAFGLFAGAVLLGLFVLNDKDPLVLMYVWDGLVVAFFFNWAVGLLVDLQQSEVLSLDKFLHLPVSLSGAFLINYLASLLSVTLVFFVPAMFGLSLGLLISRGLALVLLLPLLAAFLFMVTAVTHQFRSWLASLMVNKRRRRTVILVVTVTFILLFQVPNTLNLMHTWEDPKTAREAESNERRKEDAELTELIRAVQMKEITQGEYNTRKSELDQRQAARDKERQQRQQQFTEQLERTVRLVNMVLPLGWLPLGAMEAAAGRVVIPLLATLGMALIGSASLWRSYRTTLRLYTGHFTSGKKQAAGGAAPAAPAKVRPAAVGAGPATLLEKKLPWISEQASAIATASFHSLLRAPEVKMMFLTPVILVLVFCVLSARHAMDIDYRFRPLMAFGAMGMILLSMVQLIGNQFGFDRTGFRVFVLCAAPRQDVLLGKNLAFAPLALGLGGVLVLVLQFLKPLRWDHFLAVLPQMVSMYLLFCLLANCLSIFAPVAVAAGSMKMTNIKGLPLLLHILFAFFFPLVLSLTLLPLGIELLLEWLGEVKGIPIALPLSLLECAALLFLYRLLLPLEGLMLQSREQAILQVVAAKAE